MAEQGLVMTWRFLVFAGLFVTCLLTANVIATKLVIVGGLVLPAGVVIFPLSYIVGDVLTEVYGYAAARRVIWLGFACNVLMVAAIWLAGELPPAPVWKGQAAYAEIFAQTPRILAASFLAYLIGEFANSFTLARMKIATQGRWLWTRTVGSTIVGQGLDSVVFVAFAFAGLVPLAVLATIIVAQWVTKVAYEAAATPLTYLVVGWLKDRERMDAYDRDTDFNPLHL
jgi:queuosine precursor transporter